MKWNLLLSFLFYLWSASNCIAEDNRLLYINSNGSISIFNLASHQKEVFKGTRGSLDARVSPDGLLVGFLSTDDKMPNYQAYILDLKSKRKYQVTWGDEAPSRGPRWESNSRSLFLPDNDQSYLMTIDREEGIKRISRELMTTESYAAYLAAITHNDKSAFDEVRSILSRYGVKVEYIPAPQGKYHLLYFTAEQRLVVIDTTSGKIVGDKMFEMVSGNIEWLATKTVVSFRREDLTGDSIVIWDIPRDSVEIKTINNDPDLYCGASLAWSKDNDLLAYTCWNGDQKGGHTIKIINAKTNKIVKTFIGINPQWLP